MMYYNHDTSFYPWIAEPKTTTHYESESDWKCNEEIEKIGYTSNQSIP